MSETNPIEAAPRRGVPVWIQLIVWAGLIGLLIVLALGLKNNQQGSVQIGDTPNFTLKFFDAYSLQGKPEFALSDLRGKVVMINFWASWCVPCADEAPALEAAWKYYQPSGKVVFIGVDYIDTPTQALAYLKQFNISYPNGPDLETHISQLFHITGVPETYVIDQDGKLVYAWVSPFESEAQIHAVIDPLLKK